MCPKVCKMVTIKKAVRYYIRHRTFKRYSVQKGSTSFIDVLRNFAQKVSPRNDKKPVPLQNGYIF